MESDETLERQMAVETVRDTGEKMETQSNECFGTSLLHQTNSLLKGGRSILGSL